MFSFYNILKSCNAVVLCNQCLSPLKLWVRTPFMAKCTRYNIMWWSLSVTCDRSVVSPGTPVSSTNKTGGHDIAEILLKVALNNINPNLSLMQLLTNGIFFYSLVTIYIEGRVCKFYNKLGLLHMGEYWKFLLFHLGWF